MARAALIAAAGVAWTLGGCGSHEGVGTPSEAESDAGVISARRLAESPAAVSLVRDLRAEFRYRPTINVQAPSDEPISAPPPEPQLVSVIPEGVAQEFTPAGARRFHPVVADDASRFSTRKRAVVELPTRASEPARVQDETTGMAIEPSIVGARNIRVEVADGLAVYQGATADGFDIIQRPHLEGTEDYVILRRSPAKSAMAWSVRLEGVKGVRLVANTVEFQDDRGVPRLRMSAPYLVDKAGTWHPGSVALAGCSFDTSEELPFDRPVTPPDSDRCEVTVSWDSTQVEYPAVLDPGWTTTGSMATARAYHVALQNLSGDPVVIGGLNASGAVATSETYTSGAWTLHGTMSTGRYNLGASWVTMPSCGSNAKCLASASRLVVTGGYDTAGVPLASAMCYCAGWQSIASMSTARAEHTQTSTPSGQAMIVGGTSDGSNTLASTEIFNGSSWSAGPSLNTARQGHSATWFNSLVVVGGTNAGSSLASYERWNEGDTSWSSGTTPRAHGRHAAVVVPDNPCSHLVIAGGVGNPSQVDIYAGTWETVPFERCVWGWSQLNDLTTRGTPAGATVGTPYGFGYALVAGGSYTDISGMHAQANSALLRKNNPAIPAGNMLMARYGHTATSYGNYRALIAGGSNGSSYLSSAELFSMQADGGTCGVIGECISGNCVDGYCCDTPCSGTCEACSNALTGQANGSCQPIPSGQDPGGECNDQGATSCGLTGSCSGSRSCAYYPVGTVCASKTCSSPTTESWTTCAGPNSCTQPASNSCVPYVCESNACRNSCINDSHCSSGNWCSGGVCIAKLADASSCSGSNQCQSGFCVDGYCCSTACTGGCEACSAAKNGSTNGTCLPVPDGVDPDNECGDQGAASCGTDGMCNGSRACRQYASGTACAASTCTGTNQTNWTCNGTGTCTSSVVPCASGYLCGAATCNTSCASDGQCTSAYWCNTSTSTCDPDKGNGQSCLAASQCVSGNCVDGYCCDTACAGLCEACSAAKSGGSNGICTAMATGTDPDSECSQDIQSSCQQDGTCDGARQCRKYLVGTACGAVQCVGNVTKGQKCDGTGVCQLDDVGTDCSPYICAAGVCPTACASDSQCTSGYFCDGAQHCTAKLTIGVACAAATQCVSGNCADGVCCDSACNNTCQACTAALKESGVNTGYCGAAKSGTDPHNECPDEGAASCDRDGFCNGSGACRVYGTSTSCGPTVCQGNVSKGQLCDGLGSCATNATGTECSPYFCQTSTGSCPTTCTADTECTTGYYCDVQHHCTAKAALGNTCTAAKECLSGFCVDSVCCNTACSDTCQACAATLKESQTGNGLCGPAKAGSDPHNECTDDGAATCDRDGYCNGAGACRLYSSSTSCGPTVCNGNVATGQLCDGVGVCKTNSTGSDCTPYLCQGGACPTACAGDSQCVATAYCDVNSHCVTKAGPGATCTAANQCLSGFCVDGYCCDTACDNLCVACAASKKESGVGDGTCGPAKSGTDPRNQCTDSGAASCKQDGTCNGSGACRLYNSTTSCGPTECNGNVSTGQLCDGAGECKFNSTGTDCHPYLCTAGKCPDNCASDSQCTSDAFCDPAGHCVLRLAIGQACATASQCTSGFCVDGVCCNQACTGLCQACSAAKKVTGDDGDCGPIDSGADPDSECPDEGSASCKRDGACDGAGACRLYAKGTSCGSTQCSGNTVTGQICDGFGACGFDSQGTPCSPYECQAGKCTYPCTNDAHCVVGRFCDPQTAQCKSKKGNGEACQSLGECLSGYCVDGVCCDTACNNECVACNAALKTSGVDGVCGFAAQGFDPHGTCDKQSQATCGRTGECNGGGTCEVYGAGTACGSTTCSGNKVSGYVCDGWGVCKVDTAGTDCAPYKCVNDACATDCTIDADCVSGAVCVLGECATPINNGGACIVDKECESGHCADQVCCDKACDGQCEACDVTPGTCETISGKPHGNRPTCSGAAECQGTCDGVDPATCAMPGSAVSCASSCENGTESSGSCDGTGHCTTATSKPCSPYVCDGTIRCKTNCTTSDDCASGFTCEADQCVGSTDGGVDAENEAGQDANPSEDAAPGEDAAGTPDGSGGTGAAPAQATSDESGGCGCRTAGQSGEGRHSIALLLLVGAAVARRRLTSRLCARPGRRDP